jgi:hypothetical protein
LEITAAAGGDCCGMLWTSTVGSAAAAFRCWSLMNWRIPILVIRGKYCLNMLNILILFSAIFDLFI